MEIYFLEFLIYRQNTISNSFSEKDQGHAVLPAPQSLEGTTLEQAFDAGMRWTYNFKAQKEAERPVLSLHSAFN